MRPVYRLDNLLELYWGLENGVDSSLQSDPWYTYTYSRVVRHLYEQAYPVSLVIGKSFDEDQLDVICDGLEFRHDIDITSYVDPRYSVDHIVNIQRALEDAARESR